MMLPSGDRGVTPDEWADVEAIKALRHAYAMHYDARELDALIDLLAVDAIFHFPPQFGGDWSGREAIRANFSRWMATGEAFDTVHAVVNPVVALTGPDSADGRGMLFTYHSRQGDDPALTTPGGHENPLFLIAVYEDRYRKVDGGWKLARMRLSTLWPTRDYTGPLG